MVFSGLKHTTRKVCIAILPLLGFVATLFFAPHCAAVNDVAGNLVVWSDNGAWSWFEDERWLPSILPAER
jgi:hypothetical protein